MYQQQDSYGCNMLKTFKVFQQAEADSPLHSRGMQVDPEGQFEYDAMHDKLPAVSWIIPTSFQSEHPDFMPADGAAFVASKIDAIAANPDVWAKTVFILNYDENDGLFDHVPRPFHRRARRKSSWEAFPLAADSACPAFSFLHSPRAVGFPANGSTIRPFFSFSNGSLAFVSQCQRMAQADVWRSYVGVSVSRHKELPADPAGHQRPLWFLPDTEPPTCRNLFSRATSSKPPKQEKGRRNRVPPDAPA